MEKIRSKTQQQTAAANAARWSGESVEERWAKKRKKIITFLSRFGWAPATLINFYLDQKCRDWSKKLQIEGLIYAEKVPISHSIIPRNGPSSSIATVMCLTSKGQKLAKIVDDEGGKRLGRRVPRINKSLTRHDLVSMWVAVYCIKNIRLLREEQDELELWSDQILRGLKEEKIEQDNYGYGRVEQSKVHRPDIKISTRKPVRTAIYYDSFLEIWMKKVKLERSVLHIEVERSRKKAGSEQYEFIQKLESFTNDEIDLIIVFESMAYLVAMEKLLHQAQRVGIPKFLKSNGKWRPLASREIEIFKVSAILALWDHEKKEMTYAVSWNMDKSDSHKNINCD